MCKWQIRNICWLGCMFLLVIFNNPGGLNGATVFEQSWSQEFNYDSSKLTRRLWHYPASDNVISVGKDGSVTFFYRLKFRSSEFC